MSKAVLISIQPKWCELIASGKKTVEVRKTRPKIDTPFKCYIYCTKPRHYYKISKHLLISDESLFLVNGEVRMCDGFGVEYEDAEYKHLNCKVIGEFVCNCMTALKADNMVQAYFNNTNDTCLTDEEIKKYANNGKLYYWHISDLVIYDKPRELSEFYQIGKNTAHSHYDYCAGCVHHENPVGEYPCIECDGNRNYLYRPPQSWCYVEERGE